MDIGGNKRNEKDNRKKSKSKGKEIADEEITEEDKPRNRKYMEDEKKSGKRIKVSDDGDDCPSHWDWRHYLGVTSNVIDQQNHLICWAIAFIRAVEALFNIGKRLEHQRSFSIQHLINNIDIGIHGLEDSEYLHDFVTTNGILEEGECSYTRAKGTCVHNNPKTESIGFRSMEPVEDVELAKLVWKHPVVGVVPLWSDFHSYRHGIYRPRTREITTLSFHAVLIVGFGVDQSGEHYWIIQNTAGRNWGQDGYCLLHREHRRGRQSLFVQAYYPVKMGYPQQKK